MAYPQEVLYFDSLCTVSRQRKSICATTDQLHSAIGRRWRERVIVQ